MIRFVKKLFYNYGKDYDYEEELYLISRLPPNQIPLFLEKQFLINISYQEISNYGKWEIHTLINSDEYIIKGKKILELKPLIFGSGMAYFIAPFHCKLIKILKTNKVGLNELVLIVEKIDSLEDFEKKLFEQNSKKIFLTEFVSEYDEFNDSITFYLKNICGEEFSGLRLYNLNEGLENEYLEFGLKGDMTHLFLMVYTNSNSFTLANNDTLIFLFEDDTRLKLKFEGRHTGRKGNYRNIIHLTKENQEVLFLKKLKKIKIESNLKGIYSVFSFSNFENNNQYDTFKIGQFAFNYIIQFYLSNLKEYRKHL